MMEGSLKYLFKRKYGPKSSKMVSALSSLLVGFYQQTLKETLAQGKHAMGPTAGMRAGKSSWRTKNQARLLRAPHPIVSAHTSNIHSCYHSHPTPTVHLTHSNQSDVLFWIGWSHSLLTTLRWYLTASSLRFIWMFCCNIIDITRELQVHHIMLWYMCILWNIHHHKSS